MSDNSTPIAGGDTYATDQAATLNGAGVTPATKFPINKIAFGTRGTVREVDASNPLPVTLPGTSAVSAAAILNVTASGTLTASDAVVAAPIGDGTIIIGASTAGSVVAVVVPDGLQAWTLLIKGYVSGAIYTEASNNSTTGTDGDWVEIKGRRTGTAPGVESVVYAMVANGYYRGNAAGFKYIRARLIGGTGPTIQWVLSYGQGATFLNSGIPLGSSVIGKVGIDQTTPGTTNAVQVTNASFAVTGTFFQATQPVSLAALPALTAGAAAIGSITNTSFAVTNAGTFPVQSAATLSAETTKVIGTVNLSAAQTLAAVTAITNALPAGTNIIGSVKLTDGTSSAAFKAASTAPVAADPALVVALSPNGNSFVTPDVTVAATLTALNDAVLVPMAGRSTATIELPASGWTGTVAFEVQVSSGGAWYPVNGVSSSTSFPATTTTVAGAYRLTPNACLAVRARLSVVGAGSIAATAIASIGSGGVYLNQIGPMKLTDGVSTAAIKPASTPATLADAALVVQTAQLPAAVGGTTSAASLPVVLSTDTATGTITTQNLVPGGVATAGSAVEITLNGAASIAPQAVGTYTGALSLQVTVDGANWITAGGAPFVSINTGGYLAAITSALTGIFQADVGGFTKARITALAAVTGSVVVTIRSASASSMVALDAGLPAGANSIGSVTQATAANFNATVVGNGTFAVQSAMTPVTPTASIVNSAATTNATSVKASAGTIYQITATNSGAAAAFLKIYNLAVAPTVGTSVPALTLAVPPSGVLSVNLGTMGLRLGTGISLAITNLVADTDTTVVAANQVKSAISYI